MFFFVIAQAFSQSANEIAVSDSIANTTDDTIKEDVITQPEFKGGIDKMYEYIAINFQYPDDAAKRSVSGKMEVEFTVEKTGSITYVGVLKGLDYSVDDEIVRLLKNMPKWIPATKNGEPVRYRVNMPITIRASRTRGLKSSYTLQDYREQ